MDPEFYDCHADALIRFFRCMVGDEAAEDLAQETFARFVAGRHRMRDDCEPRVFLYGIAWHVFREYLRKQTRRRAIDPMTESMAALDPSPSSIAAGQHRQRKLHEALRQLSIADQIAIQLHYWEGLTFKEIGEILEINPSTLRTRMSAAAAKLRASMGDSDRPDAPR